MTYSLPRRAPDGAPNVLVVLFDDLGFAQLGCYGSEIETPAIDRLAAGGLRYNRFHVTALCSPSRAALLTGRNHHAVGMGFLADVPLDLPGYHGHRPPAAGTLPQALTEAGYSAYAIGKWHLTPTGERSHAGPFTSWPLGWGFEKYYGFLQGDTNHWSPHLVQDNQYVEPPAGPEDGYHLTEDLADTAIRYLRDQQQATPDKPFFCYLSLGAMHAPHHVSREWADRYEGRFDDGWTAMRERVFARQVESGVVPETARLTEQPPWIPDWGSLTDADRRLYARMQETYAGFLSHTDAQIGRVLDALDQLGELDNTIVMVLSDNGASAEGGVQGHPQRAPVQPPPTRVDRRQPGPRRRLGRLPDLQPLRLGVGVGGQRSVPPVEAVHLARRHPQPAHRPLARPDHRRRGGPARRSATSSTSCRPCSTPPASVCPTSSMVWRSSRSTVARWPTRSPTPTRRTPERCSTSSCSDPGPSSRASGRRPPTTSPRASMDEERLLVGSRDFADDTWALFRLDDDFAEGDRRGPRASRTRWPSSATCGRPKPNATACCP